MRRSLKFTVVVHAAWGSEIKGSFHATPKQLEKINEVLTEVESASGESLQVSLLSEDELTAYLKPPKETNELTFRISRA